MQMEAPQQPFEIGARVERCDEANSIQVELAKDPGLVSERAANDDIACSEICDFEFR
jgi:hypothetical protein